MPYSIEVEYSRNPFPGDAPQFPIHSKGISGYSFDGFAKATVVFYHSAEQIREFSKALSAILDTPDFRKRLRRVRAQDAAGKAKECTGRGVSRRFFAEC